MEKDRLEANSTDTELPELSDAAIDTWAHLLVNIAQRQLTESAESD